MSESTPTGGDSNKQPQESSSRKSAVHYSTPQSGTGGCFSLLGGAIGGFFLFVILGYAVSGLNDRTFGILYLITSFVAAIWLATKPRFRGFAIGIFLGMGAVLLLISICSGFHIGG